LIFFGDVAVSSKFKVDYLFDLDEPLLINCEGYLVEDNLKPHVSAGVFNNIKSIRSCFGAYNLILSFANNHIMDKVDGVNSSIGIAKANKMRWTGANQDLKSSLEPEIIRDNGCEIALISAGWDLIGCKHATNKQQGVAPLLKKHLEPVIKKQVELGRKVALYLHWGYETEIYPLPLHREMTHAFIELGVEIIICCHAHCIQGHEIYQGKNIFYGLGNSIFEQGYFYNGKLSFPDYCQRGLVVRWNPNDNAVQCAISTFNNNTFSVETYKDPLETQEVTSLSAYAGMGSSEYINFFKKHRVKKKLLPIFIEPDDSCMYKMKLNYTLFRGFFISKLFKLKSMLRSL